MNSVLIITVGVLLIVASIFLIVAVLMQSAKNSRMSGVVSGGGAETFFGKYKGKTVDKKLNRLTIIVALAFAAIVILMYIIQPGTGKVKHEDPNWDNAQAAMTATSGDTSTSTPATSGTTPATTPAVTSSATTPSAAAPSTPAEAD